MRERKREGFWTCACKTFMIYVFKRGIMSCAFLFLIHIPNLHGICISVAEGNKSPSSLPDLRQSTHSHLPLVLLNINLSISHPMYLLWHQYAEVHSGTPTVRTPGWKWISEPWWSNRSLSLSFFFFPETLIEVTKDLVKVSSASGTQSMLSERRWQGGASGVVGTKPEVSGARIRQRVAPKADSVGTYCLFCGLAQCSLTSISSCYLQTILLVILWLETLTNRTQADLQDRILFAFIIIKSEVKKVCGMLISGLQFGFCKIFLVPPSFINFSMTLGCRMIALLVKCKKKTCIHLVP